MFFKKPFQSLMLHDLIQILAEKATLPEFFLALVLPGGLVSPKAISTVTIARLLMTPTSFGVSKESAFTRGIG